MKVLFESEITQERKTQLTIEKMEDYVFITIDLIDSCNRELNMSLNHDFSKQQLKDFIGVLLHIQSKLNKN